MRELVFALEFRGTAGAVAGSESRRQARSVAGSQALSTVLGGEGIAARVEPVAGESAVLESRVERFGDGSFVEDGTITYGSAGTVTFETLGRGWVGPARGGGGGGVDDPRGDRWLRRRPGSDHLQLHRQHEGRGDRRPFHADVPAVKGPLAAR